MFLSAVRSAAPAAALTLLSLKHRAAWSARGITSVLRWRDTLLLCALAAIGYGTLIANAHAVAEPGIAIPAAAAAWLGTFAICTDLACQKIPREMPHYAAATGLATLLYYAVNPDTSGSRGWMLFNLTATFALIVAAPWIARVATRRGLGLSDIRMMWAFTATLSWWNADGFVQMGYGLIAACLLQIPAHLGYAAYRRRHRLPQTHLPETPSNAPDKKTRLRLPFAPALAVCILASVALFL